MSVPSPSIRAACLAVVGLVGVFLAPANAWAGPQRAPNIIYILADDLGYGDVGVYGQTVIRTPNLDRMATEGLRMTQHYAGSTVCAPSRAALMTGQHTGHTQIRGNQEFGGHLDEEERGQEPLDPASVTIAEVLKSAGYATALIGKWGLGGPGTEGEPNRHGFDYFFGYLDQKQAHSHYPSHLWRNGQRVPLNNPFIHPHPLDSDGATFAGDPADPASYAAYVGREYADDRIMDEAEAFLRSNRDGPFFLYLAPALPHGGLQIPAEELAQYADLEEPTPYLGRRYTPHPRPRAARAAMVSRVDADVGRILRLIEDLGIAENTLVIFSSDNGPAPEGGQDMDFFNASGGLRGVKRDLYEGGIRVPMIAWWPGRVPENTISNTVSASWDMMNTFAELSGQPVPEGTDGVSLTETLFGREQAFDRPLYWEFHEAYGPAQAVRQGAWKAVRRFAAGFDPDAAIELYNLDTDPRETRDISALRPDVVERLGRLLVQQRTTSPVEVWNFQASGPQAPR